MSTGDFVRVRGRIGEVIYDAPEVPIANPPSPLIVAMPKFMLYGVAGNLMNLNFALRKPGEVIGRFPRAVKSGWNRSYCHCHGPACHAIATHYRSATST